MVPTFAITDSEHLTCGGFSLDNTVRLENFEFITDYFDGKTVHVGILPQRSEVAPPDSY
jgi:hypothetical protein